LTRSRVTGSLFFVLRYRLPIALLIFFFSIVGSLNAFCLLENQAPTKSASQTPSSISCLDNDENPFLSPVYQGHKKIYFPKAEKRTVTAYQEAFLQEDRPCSNSSGPPGAISFPLSISIYQLKTVYLI